MANVIHGFYDIPVLHNNTDNVEAKFGELSPTAMTMSRYSKTYTQDSSNVEFIAFNIVDLAGARRTISLGVANRIVSLGRWLYEQYDTAQIPVQIQATLFANAIANEHNVTNVTLGTISAGTSASKRMPAWVRFTMTEGGEDFDVKVWVEGTAFFDQYPEKETFVISPTPSLSDLQLNFIGLTTILASGLVLENYVDREQAITAGFPKTSTVRLPLTWHEPNNPSVTLTVTWCLIVYGNAGNDTDAIKEAIRDYLAANSTETNWPDIFPELYNDNEFALVPLWDKVAAPSTGGLEVIYSPTATIAEINAAARAKLPASYVSNTTQGTTFLNENARFLPTNYRQIGVICCGSPSNNNSISDIEQLYPDITTLASSSPDYSRMTANTRGLLEKVLEALDIAYNYTITSAIPSGFSKLNRSGRTFIAFSYLGYQYMVMTRLSN